MSKKLKWVFYSLYAVGFLGAGIIGFFSKSYFAYDKFNSLWAIVLYLIFLSMLYITAFVHEVFLSRKVKDIITNFAVFIGALIFLLLFYFIGGVAVFLTIVYSAVMLAVIGCKYAYALRDDPHAKPDMKRVLAVASLFLFSMVALLDIEFVDGKVWLWGLIPASVIFTATCIVGYFLLKKVWKYIYPTEGKAVGNAVCVVIIFLMFSYIFSVFALGIANCAFDGEPVREEYAVLDKRIENSSRGPTIYKVKVEIDGEEKWIPISVTDYYELEDGDAVLIDYCSGAFNIPYYYYYGKE